MSAPTPVTTDAGIDDAGVPDAPSAISVVTADAEAPPAGAPEVAAGAAPPLVAPALPQASRIRRAAASLGWAAVGVAIFVALWALAASRNPKLPTPGDTFTNLREMLADPFYDNGPDDKGVGVLVWATLLRVFKGWALATLVGVPLGLLIGTSRRAWSALNPLVQVLRPVSPLAWFPILAFALGASEIAAVWTVFVIALWPTVLNTATGAAAVPVDQRDVARVFRFGRFTYLRHVLFPNVLPYMVTGLRLSMGIGWIVIVAIEMLGGTSGIGRQIWTWYNALDLPKVAAGIVIVGVVGLVLDTVLMRLAKAVAIDEGSPS
jgi:nitrate/nitrite transport system permease protein